MIGDTLFDCGKSLDYYLTNYESSEEVAERIRTLREEIRAVQTWIDKSHAELLVNVRLRRAPHQIQRFDRQPKARRGV